MTPFMLDSHDTMSYGSFLEHEDRDQAIETELQRLMREVRLWRPASAVKWVAWGIVQATIPEMEEALSRAATASGQHSEGNCESADDISAGKGPIDGRQISENKVQNERKITSTSGSEDTTTAAAAAATEEAGEEEFDYLAFAQERALFFLADLFSLDIIKEEELPVDMLPRIKEHILDY